MTFALPDDKEIEDTDVLNVKKDPDEVKSSFEKRQEKVIIRNLRKFLCALHDCGTQSSLFHFSCGKF